MGSFERWDLVTSTRVQLHIHFDHQIEGHDTIVATSELEIDLAKRIQLMIVFLKIRFLD